MLKVTLAADSLVEYRLTGTETIPNEIVAEAIERAGIGIQNNLPSVGRKTAPLRF
jgi:hypothetical protein